MYATCVRGVAHTAFAAAYPIDTEWHLWPSCCPIGDTEDLAERTQTPIAIVLTAF